MEKDYNKIWEIPDQNLAKAVAYCTDDALLSKLRLAFPECFYESDGRVGLSRIRHGIEREEGNDLIDLLNGILGIEVHCFVHPDWINDSTREHESNAKPMTSELVEKWESWREVDFEHSSEPFVYFTVEGQEYILLYTYEGDVLLGSSSVRQELMAILRSAIDESR